jgi:hypothetical protein
MLVKLKKLEHLKLRYLSWETISATAHCSALKTVEYQAWISYITDYYGSGELDEGKSQSTTNQETS